jgi:hypothetical protein
LFVFVTHTAGSEYFAAYFVCEPFQVIKHNVPTSWRKQDIDCHENGHIVKQVLDLYNQDPYFNPEQFIKTRTRETAPTTVFHSARLVFQDSIIQDVWSTLSQLMFDTNSPALDFSDFIAAVERIPPNLVPPSP